MNIDFFNNEMKYNGYSLFPGYLEEEFLTRLRLDLEAWLVFSKELREKNGLADSMSGVAHNIVGKDDAMAEYLRLLPLHEYLKKYFGGPYILNSFSGLKYIRSEIGQYEHAQNFHRDVRVYSRDVNLMINIIVMLDDFTVENGATRLLPGSHVVEEKPSEEYLNAKSIQITGKAGTIVAFDSNIWHSASKNLNGESMRALTINYTKPFLKQQIEFTKLVNREFSENPEVLDVIGFRARTPQNHSDWYQKGDKRFYHSDQR